MKYVILVCLLLACGLCLQMFDVACKSTGSAHCGMMELILLSN
jgi:hypothetical protein